MRHSLVWSAGIALTLACGSTPLGPEQPFLRGVITSRAPILVGVQVAGATKLDSIPAMFVDGVGIWPAPEPCAARARFTIGTQTRVFRHDVGVDTAQLVVGQRVAVWITGVVLESCPPQASASRVVLDEWR
jgi:hypothetical protein